MKSSILIPFVVGILFMITGCLPTYFPLGYYTSASPMIIEPDSVIQPNGYVQVDYAHGPGEHESEWAELFRASIIASKTSDYVVGNVMAYGYAGQYDVRGLTQYNGTHTGYGLGAEAQGGINTKFEKFKLGLGMSVGGIAEFGEYYHFRKSAARQEIIDDLNSEHISMLLTLFPFMNFSISETTSLSAQLKFGMPGGLSPIIAVSHKQNVYWLNFMRNDLGEFRFAAGVSYGLHNW